MAHLGKAAMDSPEAKQKPTAAVGVAHLLVDDHNPVHNRRSWRLLINAAIVVLLLSCAFVNSAWADEKEDASYRYFKLGQESYAKGQYRKAIGFYEKALAILRGALPMGHPYIRTTEQNLAAAKKQQ